MKDSLAKILPCVIFTLISTGHVFAQQTATTEQLEFFERSVRPLLVEHCYSCHSNDAKQLRGSLYVDSRQGLIEGGDSGEAIVPGDATNSLFMEAVRYEGYEMPPKGKLAPKDIDTFAKWIEMGAPWPKEESTGPQRETFDLEKRAKEHWAWQPVASPTLPTCENSHWVKQELDHFVLAKLEQQGLTPSKPADRNAIFRRLYMDIIGLPPTAEQLRAFEQDDSENAIENVVDQLLQSPYFGERWGRHWLDLVRYAESRGHEFDNDTPNAFQYRDYVIRALNADTPYDQLIREHIAGDLLKNPRLHPQRKFNESILGTGFWFLGEWVHSPVDILKDESDRFDNMIDVMSKAFQGVTVSCARCHDHKFDAISTADYYSLTGFLHSSDYRQVRFESIQQNGNVARQLAKIDDQAQRKIIAELESQGIPFPKQASFIDNAAIVVDFENLAHTHYLQDGFIFGERPRSAGLAYPKPDGSFEIVSHGSASNDPFWRGLQSETLGQLQNRNKLAKLPKNGRTLRSPTFRLTAKHVDCMVEGNGTIVACVDSHRLVNGPLHGETIVPIKTSRPWTRLNLKRYIGHRMHLEFIPAKDSQIHVRLVTQGLDAEQLSEIETRLTKQDQAFLAYATAGNQRLETLSESETRVFADFESGTYDGWTVTGKAFGNLPQRPSTIAKYQGSVNQQGTWFINSHNIREGGDARNGDSLTGTLTSPKFKIDFDAITFLVGGGNHQGKTCVNLMVDGEIVRTATGKANNRMASHQWDVRNLSGKTACIEVVDQHRGGWGNIGLDHICFVKNAEGTAGNLKLSHILSQWKRQRTKLQSQVQRSSQLAPAMLDGTGEDAQVYIRGDSSKPGKTVARHYLTALCTDQPMRIAKGSGRLELAAAINASDNPLTSRVMANRIWHYLMGRGIVPTTDDFGVLGALPTHPELLDHLATKFTSEGQSLKKLIRYIVLSQTYQMSSIADATSLKQDPKNSFWHHRPPKRLEGEIIRDSLLALSGKLDTRQFGPPVPIHLTSFMDGRGRPKNSGPLDGEGRRSIYISVRRNFLSPFMLAFDTPVPFSTMGKRNVSNVPAQALILMNDPFVIQQSQRWAERAKLVANEPAKRLAWMYQTAFGRSPTDRELKLTLAYLGKAPDAERWNHVAHALINTKEFIFLR